MLKRKKTEGKKKGQEREREGREGKGRGREGREGRGRERREGREGSCGEQHMNTHTGKDSFILLSKMSLYMAADITSSIGHMMPYSSQPFS